MKRILLLSGIILVASLQSVWGDVPKKMSYQGVLTDANDVVVPDGNYTIRFRIHSVPVGGLIPVWEETLSVAVENGRFNVILGKTTPLDGVYFDQAYWLALKVEDDPEMTPRVELAAAPYSMNAYTVQDGAITTMKIANGHVVRSVNGLTEYVTLAGGDNVTITQDGQTLNIAAPSAGADNDWTVSGDNMYSSVSGRVGIGTASPSHKLHVNGHIRASDFAVADRFSASSNQAVGREVDNDQVRISGGTGLDFVTNGIKGAGIILEGRDYGGSDAGGGVKICAMPGHSIRFQHVGKNGVVTERMIMDGTGDIGIGTANPTTNLDIVDDAVGVTGIRLRNASTAAGAMQRITMDNEEGPMAGIEIYGSGNVYGNRMVVFNNRSGGEIRFETGGSARMTLTENGRLGLGPSNPQAKLDVSGTTRTHVLEITAGADLAELFDISDPEELEPGSVVVIDDAKPGALKISMVPYDTRVAGVISGAGGVNTGLTLSQEGLTEDGQKVALSGRVYVRCTVANGAIQPGDLLTTSSMPGHAMKATDSDKTSGAVLGKAMSRLDHGEGLVLSLVSLQ